MTSSSGTCWEPRLLREQLAGPDRGVVRTRMPSTASAPFADPSPHTARPAAVDLGDLANDGSELRGAIERYSVDRNTLHVFSASVGLAARDQRVREFNDAMAATARKTRFRPAHAGGQGRLSPLQELSGPPASPA